MIKLLELTFNELLLLDFSLEVLSLTGVLCFLFNQVWKRKSQCSEKKNVYSYTILTTIQWKTKTPVTSMNLVCASNTEDLESHFTNWKSAELA